MITRAFHDTAVSDMHNLLTSVDNPNVVDFDEKIQLDSIKVNTQLWYQDNHLLAFAFVDPYNNLCFEVDSKYPLETCFSDIVAWGVACMQKRNADSGKQETLDASCFAINKTRVNLLREFGFELDTIRSFSYERDLAKPITNTLLPTGFTFSHIKGEHQVEQLVTLHRAAFRTQYMTVEERLAIMRTSNYEMTLDLLVLAPNGSFAAYCTCEVENEDKGSTDPIAVHPSYQAKGIGKAILTKGLEALKAKHISKVYLGTSSRNTAMMQLAESVGFRVVSEKLWFAKVV